MSIPEDLRYTKDHEWARIEGDIATVGITHHAQDALGDIVYVEVPEEGSELTQGETCGVVESVKAVSDLFAPLSGPVIQSNAELADAPETLNRDPYGAGWLVKMTVAEPAQVDALLDAKAYLELLEAETK